MGRIRILSDTVANQIAAGEVVERPASVVKELLENALDAGSSELRITVESAGRRLIRIADNGCGMSRDDAMLAFERHATSKLASAKDLLSIATLGFRGEALPSIASVSRLLLETRTADEPLGTVVEIAGGKLLRCDEAALASGTVITVRDLFYNVPARKKFLRSDSTELAHVASLVTHYSLAHPDRGFELHHGTTELLNVAPVTELRERVYQVFGSQTMEDLVDIGTRNAQLALADGEVAERSFSLRGFISRPQVQKPNRNSIFLFVNRRLIRDKLLMHAISSAYHNLMPGGLYPFALLFLDCDCEEVDVNVHPAKTEVRFRHPSFVHDLVRDALRETLMAERPAPSVPPRYSPVSSGQAAPQLPYSEFSQRAHEMGFDPPTPAEAEALESLPVFTLHREAGPAPRFDFDAAPTRLPVPDSHGALPFSDAFEPASMSSLRDLRPLGQLQDSFIIAAGRDGLWIVDQHVAHERVLFEQVLAVRESGRAEVQQLLMPLVIGLTAAQQIEYARIADELNATGFDVEPFGNRTVAVKGAPAGIGPAEVEQLVLEILETAEKELRSVSLEDQRRAIAASVACRAAIKINTRLDMEKMRWLLAALAATRYPMSCPHGRPVALRYSMRDILKSFHRIG